MKEYSPVQTERIREIVEEYDTPLYLYDIETIVHNVSKVKEIFSDYELFYSVKANPSLSICALLRQHGVGAEVASGGELQKVRKAGFAPDDIIFVGPGKSDEELELAVREGIQAVVIESSEELQRLEQICRGRNERMDVLLRINTKTQVDEAPEQMVGGSSRFGLDEENVVENIDPLDLNNVSIIGIHAYAASQVLDSGNIIGQIKYISELSSTIADQIGFELEIIDYGGGFGVPYSADDTPLNLNKINDGIVDTTKSLKQSHPNFTPAFELGRYFVAEAGVYLTKVISIKKSRGELYLITKGGMNHFIRPVFTGTEHPITNFSRSNAPEKHVNVVGKLCTPFDIFGEEVVLSDPQIGDFLGVLHTGAYGFSMSMLNFLSHPWPAELIVTSDNTYLIRKGGTMADLQGDERLIEF